MTRFQDINENIDCFKLRTKQGYISTTWLAHFAIYSRYDHYRKRGHYVGISVFYTSEDMGISESLVYKIIKEMEEGV